jgi:AraC-like DNA-binding protein
MESLRELSDRILRRTEAAPSAEPNAFGLKFSASRSTPLPIHGVFEPFFNLVVQGEKRVTVADNVFTCKSGQFLIVSLGLPVATRCSITSTRQPFVALGMKLKAAAIATLLLETEAARELPAQAAGMGVSNAPAELVEVVLRLVRLLDHPRDLPVLGPLAEREILWRLLRSEQGQRVRQIGLADSRLSQVGRVTRWIRDHYTERVRVEDLARLAAMSVTSFHRQFRAVTLMSPLQYLKQIRLQEARARLLTGADDVGTVGHAVGYDSPSQFSREYKRAYGSPPGQDASLLRASHAAPARVQRS